jgi:asparagine synthase (glutamine-hydrolysing)
MSNEDGSVWISYNGEIFNHADLRPELEASGHRYKTHCDTEAIIHAFEQFGAECLQRFRGMFAFVLWDEKKQTLFCARDRLGIKPFYYYCDGRLFVFASEIKALLEHPEISARLEESSLAETLSFGYTNNANTMFRGIHKLMPGHHLSVALQDGRLNLRFQQYWDVPWPPAAVSPRTDQEWIAEFRQRLEETVRMRLMSDVPLGVFLSGGLDSSAIAALIRRMVPGPVKSFSVGYGEERYSELGFAQQVARHIGSEHHEVRITAEDFLGSLPQLIWHEDEPITWPSSVSLYHVARLASKHVTVVLTGEGSDELFGGYGRYRFFLKHRPWAAAYSRVPQFIRHGLRNWIQGTSLLSADLRRKLSHTCLMRSAGPEGLLVDNFYSAFSGEEVSLLRPGAGSPYENFLTYWNHRGDDTPLERMLYTDQKTYLAELLMKQDQMSMACSIESRVPLLDHTFVEFASRIPASLKITGQGKHIFKKAVEDLLPHDIIYRTKMGFPTPISQWLRQEPGLTYVRELTSNQGFVSSLLDQGRVRSLVERHLSGREDLTDPLWRLINLQIWGDLFITGRRQPLTAAKTS